MALDPTQPAESLATTQTEQQARIAFQNRSGMKSQTIEPTAGKYFTLCAIQTGRAMTTEEFSALYSYLTATYPDLQFEVQTMFGQLIPTEEGYSPSIVTTSHLRYSPSVTEPEPEPAPLEPEP